jgi:hydrogenase maturation protease
MAGPEIVVLGVGNLLLSDEGVGVHVARRLRTLPFPPSVEIVDGGTAGLDLIEFCRGKRKIIIVDAVLADDEPGAILRLRPEDLSWPPGSERYSSHQDGLQEFLRMCPGMIPHAQVLIFGIVPATIDVPGMVLSAALQKRMDHICRLLLEECSH